MAEFQIYSSPGSVEQGSPTHHNQISPSRYDVDFYRRKTDRLEEDLLTLSDQLNKARLRLRRAQDFQIKYDILFKQKSVLEEESMKKDKQLFDLRSKNEEINLLMREKGAKNVQQNKQKMYLLKEIQIWKQKTLEAEEKSKLIVAAQQNRAGQTIEKELILIKRNFAQAEQQYKFQIGRLTKQLQQKNSNENSVYDRNQKIRKQKQNQIARLQKVIQRNHQQYLEMVDQKNSQIDKVKNNFQQIYNDQIGNLQKNMSNQDQKFAIQLKGLRQLLEMKNQETHNLHSELMINQQNYSNERAELNHEIQLLKDKIYERERINQEELFNMKERITSLHSIDIETMQNHYQQLIEGLKNERRELQKLMEEKDAKVEYQRKQFERGREELNNVISDRDKTIKELRDSHSWTGQSNNHQINNLQQSLNKIQNQKEALNTQYQSNITFLNQQITKLANSNELKNNQIRQLHQYTAILKKQHFESLKDLENKWKNQRKERQNQRQKQRDLRQKVQEQYRQKQKLWKNKQRQQQRDLQKQRRQKNKWIVNNQKLQKQIQRLLKQNGQLEEMCMNELNKTQKTVINTGGAKRQLSNQLQRQKTDFEALKRMQIDQVKKKYQLQMTRLNNLTERLQTELANKKIEFQNLQEEHKKISSQYRNMEKINKQKLGDYHKKMATLNSEILLTQNLYQTFIDAKSKVVKKE